jgi:hypothetical protein
VLLAKGLARQPTAGARFAARPVIAAKALADQRAALDAAADALERRITAQAKADKKASQRRSIASAISSGPISALSEPGGKRPNTFTRTQGLSRHISGSARAPIPPSRAACVSDRRDRR